jgi:hypothetical protein
MLDQFLATLPAPMQRARAKAALEAQVRVNGAEFMTRRELIERCLKEGATVQEHGRFGRVLMSPDGAFFDARNVTSTGLDYAEFLLSQQEGVEPCSGKALVELNAPGARQKVALRGLLEALVEAIKASGPDGIASGHLYAVVMGQLSLEDYEACVGALVALRCVRRDPCHLLYFVQDLPPPAQPQPQVTEVASCSS